MTKLSLLKKKMVSLSEKALTDLFLFDRGFNYYFMYRYICWGHIVSVMTATFLI